MGRKLPCNNLNKQGDEGEHGGVTSKSRECVHQGKKGSEPKQRTTTEKVQTKSDNYPTAGQRCKNWKIIKGKPETGAIKNNREKEQRDGNKTPHNNRKKR